MPSMHRRERRCGPSPPILSSIPPPQSPTGESILAQMTTNCMRFTCLAHHNNVQGRNSGSRESVSALSRIKSQPIPFLPFVCQDAPPQALGPPQARSQAFKLDNITVVNEKIHLGTVVLDIPGKDLWVGGLKHHLLQSQRTNDFCCCISAPCLHVFGDTFRLDHNHVSPGIQKSPGLSNSPLHISRAF